MQVCVTIYTKDQACMTCSRIYDDVTQNLAKIQVCLTCSMYMMILQKKYGVFCVHVDNKYIDIN